MKQKHNRSIFVLSLHFATSPRKSFPIKSPLTVNNNFDMFEKSYLFRDASSKGYVKCISFIRNTNLIHILEPSALLPVSRINKIGT